MVVTRRYVLKIDQSGESGDAFFVEKSLRVLKKDPLEVRSMNLLLSFFLSV